MNHLKLGFLVLPLFFLMTGLQTGCGGSLTGALSLTTASVTYETTSAAVTFTDTGALSFTVTTVGTNHTILLTVSNSGTGPASSLSVATLDSGYTVKGGTFPGTGGTCGATLAAGATCTVALRFTAPTSGTFTTTFQLNFNDGAQSKSVTKAITVLAST